MSRNPITGKEEVREALADQCGAVPPLEVQTPPDLPDQSVGTAEIVDAAITAVKIATGAVTTPKIAADAVTTAKIATGAVTEPKVNAVAGSGLSLVRYAAATFDATGGKETGTYGLGVSIPDNAVILSGCVEVLTTFTSENDAATIAIAVESANDIVAAIAINDASSPWAAGYHDVIPDGTGSTAVKTSASREITVTVAEEALTAGKFVVILTYVVTI